jgi:hypothetical protein
LVTQVAQRPTDEVCAEARFHADNAWRKSSERLNQRHSLDLATESNPAVHAKAERGIETARGGKWQSMTVARLLERLAV